MGLVKIINGTQRTLDNIIFFETKNVYKIQIRQGEMIKSFYPENIKNIKRMKKNMHEKNEIPTKYPGAPRG